MRLPASHVADQIPLPGKRVVAPSVQRFHPQPAQVDRCRRSGAWVGAVTTMRRSSQAYNSFRCRLRLASPDTVRVPSQTVILTRLLRTSGVQDALVASSRTSQSNRKE
jgi:hypothetical protein